MYALGIVLFEMLTGERPFKGDGAAARGGGAPHRPATSPDRRPADHPPALDAVVQRAMALEPERRFPSAAGMANALEAFLADRRMWRSPRRAWRAPMRLTGAAAGAAGLGVRSRRRRPAAPPVPPPGWPRAPSPRPRRVRIRAASRTRPTPMPPSDRVPQPRTVPPGPPPPVYADDLEPEPASPWPWVAGVVGLVLLLVLGFLLFRFLSGGGGGRPTPSAADQVTVPDFVGMTFDAAQAQADDLGIEVSQAAFVESSEPPNTVVAQDPAADAIVDSGSTVRLTLAAGRRSWPCRRSVACPRARP